MKVISQQILVLMHIRPEEGSPKERGTTRQERYDSILLLCQCMMRTFCHVKRPVCGGMPSDLEVVLCFVLAMGWQALTWWSKRTRIPSGKLGNLNIILVGAPDHGVWSVHLGHRGVKSLPQE